MSSWMSQLPDDMSLASVYMPGTHVYHGIQNEYATADDVFDTVYAFLATNPQETLVVSIKQENSAPNFERIVWQLLDKRKELWYKENRWPSLHEVRGKAVVFCRFGFETQQGLHPVSWPNNSPVAFETDIGGEICIVQDWYSISSFLKIPEKAQLVLSLFKEENLTSQSSFSSLSSLATKTTSQLSLSSKYRVNFCSGATLLTAFPVVVAKGFGFSLLGFPGVNERVMDGLARIMSQNENENSEPSARGMALLLDFWETPVGLVDLVIALNFADS
ncbi:hypothetical protein OIO90_005789 [Microbotryomycetes sp. JL221]|nr:hypothetical protein OIO90_005789 [Microbotryomycetes sp. JL221]